MNIATPVLYAIIAIFGILIFATALVWWIGRNKPGDFDHFPRIYFVSGAERILLAHPHAPSRQTRVAVCVSRRAGPILLGLYRLVRDVRCLHSCLDVPFRPNGHGFAGTN